MSGGGRRAGPDEVTRSPSPRARCSRPSTSPSKVSTRATVSYPSAKRSGTMTSVRIVAAGGRSVISPPLPGRPARTVARGRSAAARRPRSGGPRRGGPGRSRFHGGAPSADDPVRPRVAHEEGRHDDVQLVGEPGAEELGVHALAALDHEAAHAPGRQVLAHPAHRRGGTGVDDRRHAAEALARPGRRRGGAVDELVAVAGREERRRGVEVRMPRDGHLPRRRGATLGDPPGPSVRPAHDEARVVGPHRSCADEDRVAARPHGVDPVEVGGVGQHEPPARGVVEVAVEGHRPAQHGVRTLSHGPRLPRAWRRRRGVRWREPAGCRTASGTSAASSGRRGAGRRRAGSRRGRSSRRRRPRRALAAAPSPAAANAHAAAPSRGPHPARFSGTADTSRTSRATRDELDDLEPDPDDPGGERRTWRRARRRRRGTRRRSRRMPSGCTQRPATSAAATRATRAPSRRPSAPRPRQRDATAQRQAGDGHPRRDDERGALKRAGRRAAPPRSSRRGRPARDERSQATARRPRPTSSTSRPWLHAAADVTEDPAGQGDVEELGAVAGGDRRRHRQLDTQSSGDEPPAPRGARGRQRRRPRPRRRGPRRPWPEGVEDRTAAEPRRRGPRGSPRRPAVAPSATTIPSIPTSARRRAPAPRTGTAHGAQLLLTYAGRRRAGSPGRARRSGQQVEVVHGDAEPPRLQVDGPPRQVRGTRVGQLGPLLAGGADPAVEPLRREGPAPRVQPPRARGAWRRRRRGTGTARRRRRPRRAPAACRPPAVRRWWSSKAAPRTPSSGSAGVSSTRPVDRERHAGPGSRPRRSTARGARARRRSACRAVRMR